MKLHLVAVVALVQLILSACEQSQSAELMSSLAGCYRGKGPLSGEELVVSPEGKLTAQGWDFDVTITEDKGGLSFLPDRLITYDPAFPSKLAVGASTPLKLRISDDRGAVTIPTEVPGVVFTKTACTGAEAARSTAADPLDKFLSAYIANRGSEAKLRYRSGQSDLNGDGVPETIVWLDTVGWCGSGGCQTLVLALRDREYILVSETTITWPPIQVLPTSTNGWRDLSVALSGGGLEPYDAILRFDGRHYPLNPTSPPAEAAPARPAGEVIIAPLR